MFVLAFVKDKMLSFRMESLKVMEKFDSGNFHLWKFKMHMMFSKHGLWKFIDGSATIPNDEDQITDYNEKATKDLHYFVNISRMHNLHTFNIAKMSKALGRHFVVCTNPRLSETSYFFEGGSSPSKCKKGKTYLHTSTW
jgi:hypothetical protein